MSARLGISWATVRTHVEHISEKLAPYFAAAQNAETEEPWSLLYAEFSKYYPFLPQIGGKEFVTSVLDEFPRVDRRFVELRYERQYTIEKISKDEGKKRTAVRNHIQCVEKSLHQRIIAAAQEKGKIK